MTAVQQFTKPFKRLFDKPLDIDQVFNTLVDMDAYLSSGNRYAGQIVSCLETNAVYILNETKDVWIKSGEDDIHQRLHAMDSEADHAADPDKAGRIIMYDAPDGKVIATEFVAVNVDPEPPRILITHDYVNKRLELDVNEQGIDHNNLKNVNVGDFQHITIEEKEDLHPRKHFILNPDDHAPDPDNAGRVIMFDQPDGHPVAIDIVTDTSDSFSVTKNYVGGQMILSVKDEGIDHNLLKNFCEFRHKRMVYSPELGAYLIEP